MVLNPPLILVSALFFLALSSILYIASWLVASLFLRAGASRISHAGAKRVLMAALLLPPVLAAVPTVGGATLNHTHARPYAEHHSMLCRQMFSHFLDVTSVRGSLAAGVIANGAAWLLVAAGAAMLVRLLIATIRLERELTPFLIPPSPKLMRAMERVSERMPSLEAERFYECAIPASYSSVLGFLRARCVLSRAFIAAATDDELEAVVAHEAGHLRYGDVRSTVVVGALNCLFFTLQPVRLLSRRWREAAELACDDAAVAATGKPLAMASAILRVSGVPVKAPDARRALPATSLAFADEAACAPGKRVERLMAQAQSAAHPAIGDAPGHTVGGWVVTLLLAALGIAVLVSAEAVCYAHCSLETVARLLP